MRTRGFLAYVRLLPAVMVVGGGLLVVKAAGILHDAHAQTASGPSQALSQPVSVVKSSGDNDDADSSSSEVDVLTSLSRRRAELDARATALRTQEELIAAAEKRVDDKIASLKLLQSQIQTLLGQRDAAAKKDLDALVKTYSQMKPRDAARIFNSLEDSVLVPVASQMKPDVLAAVMGLMQSEAAQKLTVKLAARLKLPDPSPPAPPAPPQALQTALAQPAPAQSTPAASPAATATMPTPMPAAAASSAPSVSPGATGTPQPHAK